MTDLTTIPIGDLIKSGHLAAAIDQRLAQYQEGYDSKVNA